jgi:hypothetical protein
MAAPGQRSLGLTGLILSATTTATTTTTTVGLDSRHPCCNPQCCMCNRYRTQLCNDGMGCRRRVCFFAHSLAQLRVPATKPFVPPEVLAALEGPQPANPAAVSLACATVQQCTIHPPHPGAASHKRLLIELHAVSQLCARSHEVAGVAVRRWQRCQKR